MLKKKIIGFLNAETDYNDAWKTLVKAYESKRSLIAEHLSKILNMPKQDCNDHKSLENLVDTARVSIMALENLGVKLSTCPEIVVKIIEDKLSQETRENWDKECERDKFPTLEKMHDFLYKTAAMISMRKHKFSSNKINYHDLPNKTRKIEYKQSATTFVTTAKICPACSNEYHPLYKCSKFLESTVYNRIKIAERAKLCKNCLRHHGQSECQFGGCKTCGKKHNNLLHIQKSYTLQDSPSDKRTENPQNA